MFVHQEPVFNNKPTLIRYSQTYEQKELKDTYLSLIPQHISKK